jgi:hypothetical protein
MADRKSSKRRRWQRKSSLQKEGFQVEGGDYMIYVRYTRRGGKLMDFAVVLNVFEGETEIQVARYDHAHGYTHLDLLDLQGRVDRKEYRDHIAIEKAIRHAIDDFQENWRSYAARCFGAQSRQAATKDRRASRDRG